MRTRLQLLGVDDEQIDAVLKAGEANSHVKIRSPIAGHVIRKYVQEGQYVDEGTPLYDVADLSTVWIQAQVYEDDMAFLPVEQSHKPTASSRGGPRVTAITRSFPDEPFQGLLTFIYPHVDQDTRTLTVRCEVANPGHKLRPGGTATVRIEVAPNQVQAVAAAATGDTERTAKLNQGLALAVPQNVGRRYRESNDRLSRIVAGSLRGSFGRVRTANERHRRSGLLSGSQRTIAGRKDRDIRLIPG